MTRAGDLDRRITIMAPGSHEDGEYGPQPGEPVVVAARIPARRLDSLPTRSEEQNQALKLSHKPGRIRIRYRNDITSDMFVIMHDEGDRKYQISSWPAEVGRREWLDFAVEAFSS